ncbi:MAG: hypothetical protein U0871_07445 [Gemmataceae bacterium]
MGDEIFSDGAVDVRAASEFTGWGRTSLYAAMADGRLPFVRLGKRRLVPRRALVELLRANVVQSPPARSRAHPSGMTLTGR